MKALLVCNDLDLEAIIELPEGVSPFKGMLIHTEYGVKFIVDDVEVTIGNTNRSSDFPRTTLVASLQDEDLSTLTREKRMERVDEIQEKLIDNGVKVLM